LEQFQFQSLRVYFKAYCKLQGYSGIKLNKGSQKESSPTMKRKCTAVIVTNYITGYSNDGINC